MIIYSTVSTILLVAASFAHPVALLARIGKTISHLKIDPVTLQISDSRILYKPIGEELQVSLAVDYKSAFGFFTLGQYLNRIPLNGSGDSSQLTVGGVLDDTPTAIAYDWLTDKIYVAISTIGPDNSARIEVCDDVANRETDGSCTVILHNRLDYLHSLVLDPQEGNMYWINAAQNQIERAFMNGQHHDQHSFLNPAASDGATLTSLALSRNTSSIIYVRTTKDGSELWQCRLYERQSCAKFFDTAHVLHVDVFGKHLFLSFSSGKLALCEQSHCEATFHEVEQLSDVEVFHVVHDISFGDQSADMSPCAVKNGGCTHICLIAKIEPKRTCACPIGTRLKADEITCEEGFNEVLLISAITGLFYVSLDTPDYTPQAILYRGYEESSHSIFDVDFDPFEGFVYWLDITDAAIKRCRFNGSDLTIVAKEGVQQSAKTFRLDIFGRNILWVDGETALIWIGKMDGSISPRILDVSIKLDNPHGIAIDSLQGVMYITDWFEQSSRIVMMNLDGSDAKIFYALEDFSYPTGIDLDIEGGRLYWAESNHSLIRSIKLDATDLSSYMQASNKLVQPYSISKLGNRIFCNSMAGRSFVEIVLRDGVLAGDHSSRVVESQIYGPIGLRAVRLKKHVKRSGPCTRSNGGCSHYCLISSSLIARCLCARGFELQKDGRKCLRSSSSIILLDSSGRRPDLVRMALRSPRNLERLHLQDVNGSPHNIACDELSSSAFIASSNDSSGSIEHVDLLSPTPRATILVSGVSLRGISHLAVESHAKLIVFSNTEFGRIEACSIDCKHRKTLAWIGIRPTIIKLDVDRSQIYYVNELFDRSSICRTPIAVNDVGGITLYKTSHAKSLILSLAIDSKGGKIYWTEQNQGVNSLHKMGMNDNVSELISRSEDRRITHLNFEENVLYYVDSKKNEFGFFDSSGFHSVHAGVKSVRDFVITHQPVKSDKNRPCALDNGGCPEFCFPRTIQKEECACGDHRFFDIVAKSCQAHAHGIIMASNGRFLIISAKDPETMLNQDHSPITTLPIDNVGLPLSIGIDELSRFATLYWIDANEPKFIRSAPTRGVFSITPQSLQVTSCVHLRALTIDTFGRQLFVSCVVPSGRSDVMVFRIQSSSALLPDKLLHIGRVVNGDEISAATGKQPVPTELAVGAGKLAYLDVSTRSGGPALIVCDVDGKNCDKASERTTLYSRLAVLPRRNQLLFTGENSINRLDMSHLDVVSTQNGTAAVRALFAAIGGEKVATVPIDEKEESFLVIESERMLIPGTARVTAIASFTLSETGIIDRSRSCMHQECTHLCKYTGDNYQCLCPLGFTISHDSSNICMQKVSCEPWEFLCRDQRTCVHSGAKCDDRLNCPDGSDETAKLCGTVDSKTWTCSDRKTRIDRFLVCDGIVHCDDESDERGCKCAVPSSEMDCAIFGLMSQPECVQRNLRCDHHYDCSNGADEDERLCSTFTPEVDGFRISFTHILFGSIVFLIALALCPICMFFFYNKKRGIEAMQSVPDRRYHFAAQNDPSLLVPLSAAPLQQYEMRTYSVVKSTSTYPSLPPPIPSLCGSTNRSDCPNYSRQRNRDHPSRFYAPPPSTESLSTYGIVIPSLQSSTASHRRIIITQHAVPFPTRNGISPPPDYPVQSSRHSANEKKTSSHRSHPSSSRKENSSQSRTTLNRSQSSSNESDRESVSLSSHSSEEPQTSNRHHI